MNKNKTQHRKKDNFNHRDYLETRNKSEEENSGCKSEFVDNHCVENKSKCEDCGKEAKKVIFCVTKEGTLRKMNLCNKCFKEWLK